MRVQGLLKICANYTNFSVTAKLLVSNKADEALEPTGSIIQQQVCFNFSNLFKTRMKLWNIFTTLILHEAQCDLQTK